MRAYIHIKEDGHTKEIRVTRTQKEIKENPSIISWYENPKERQGVIFGRIELSGDRMDGWAKHIHHIALKKSGRGYKILGFLHVQYGWQGTYGESSVAWKKKMIELVTPKKETQNV